MTYVEHLVASPLISCTWEQWTDLPAEQLVVPDACVDLLWSGERLTIAGPDTGARRVELAPGARIVGIRLRPGVAGAALGLPAGELCDEAPSAAEVLDRQRFERLLDELHTGADPHAILARAVECGAASAPDPLVRAAIAALNRPSARVAAVADELGLSARQLQRRIADAVGYGPKLLARVLRFRRLQALAGSPVARATGAPQPPLVDLALDAGYADQAHMTAEVTRLAGLSPVRFLKDRTPTAA
jgi:AraC-like DNA-binding protein